MVACRGLVLATVVFSAVLLLGASVVEAGVVVLDDAPSIRETVSVEAGQWRAYRTRLGSFDSLRITVRVSQGGPVDIFTTNRLGFLEYSDANSTQFSYYPNASQNTTESFMAGFAPPTSGEYYVIIDNSQTPPGGATPVGAVIIDIALEKTSLLPVVVGIIAAIVAVVGGTIVLIRSRRRKRLHALSIAEPAGPPSK